MRVSSKVIVVLLFLLCGHPHVSALEVPDHPEGRITDFTHTLSSGDVSYLDHKLADFEKGTTDQIVVLIIPSLEGDNLEDYSIRLAEKWKIGQEGKDNGVILLIVKNDRKLRIEVGYGLEAVLPDGLAGSIITDEIAPRLKKGQFFHGIDRGIDAIIEAISPEAIGPPVQPKTSPTQDWRWLLLLGLLPFILVIVCLFALWLNRNSGGNGSGRNGSFGYWGGGFSSAGDFSAGGFSGGGGGFGGGGASGGW
jgi:uncharacterized protein